MPQKSIELILLRQWSDCLSTPVLLFDNNRDLVYYNSASEKFLDWRFSDTGEMNIDVWSPLLIFYDKNNNAFSSNKMPIQYTLKYKIPVLEKAYLRISNMLKPVAVNSVPIMDHTNELVGVFALFWDGHDR